MPHKYIAPLLPLVAAVIIAFWFAWELTATVFRTLILGQSAAQQMRDLNANDE